MIVGGYAHFASPETYNALIPDFLPKLIVNYAAGIVEGTLGLGILYPPMRKLAATGIFLLMIAFLPLHIWDVFRDQPAMGSQTAAIVRVFIQFLFIYWPWWVRKESK